MDSRRLPRLSLDLLRGFHAAARHLSFTRAAAELCVTQPAISREVKTLEEQIGQPLFRRINRSLQLTPAGEDLQRCTEEVFALIDAAVGRLAGSGTTLAVTAPVPFASLWLGPRLPRFARLHPEIDLRVAASNDLDNMEREQLDVAIRFMGGGRKPPGGEWLADYKTFPICSQALYADAARPLRVRADLAGHVLVDFETIIGGRRWSDWENWFGAMRFRPVRPRGQQRFSHYDQVIETVVKDGGIGIGKWPHLSSHLQRGIVRAPLGGGCVASLGSLYIVAAPGAAARPDVAAFIAWLKDEARQDAERMPELILGA